MEVVFLKSFSKDLDRIKKPKEKEKISSVIKQVTSAVSISELTDIKKLSGFTDAYRIRKGDWRIGVFITDNKVEFARVAHRKDIYKIFP